MGNPVLLVVLQLIGGIQNVDNVLLGQVQQL